MVIWTKICKHFNLILIITISKPLKISNQIPNTFPGYPQPHATFLKTFKKQRAVLLKIRVIPIRNSPCSNYNSSSNYK